MSRRRSRASDRRRAEGETGAAGGAERGGRKARGTERGDREPGRVGGDRRPWGSLLLAQTGILVAVFAVAVLVAELLGAANLGVALGVGQIAFAIALVYLLVKG